MKAMRQAQKRRERNRLYGKTSRNAVKQLRLTAKKEDAQKMLPNVISLVDKLAKRGVIHKKKADNIKSGLMKRLNKLASQ